MQFTGQHFYWPRYKTLKVFMHMDGGQWRKDVKIIRQCNRSKLPCRYIWVRPSRDILLKEIPFGEDGNFSEEILVNRINSDLANDFGNLIQKVLSMIQKYSDGNIPKAYNLKKMIFL